MEIMGYMIHLPKNQAKGYSKNVHEDLCEDPFQFLCCPRNCEAALELAFYVHCELSSIHCDVISNGVLVTVLLLTINLHE